MSNPFIEENDQTRARREHLDATKKLVGNVYPNKFERSRVSGGEDTITAIKGKFKEKEPHATEGTRPTPEELERINAELKEIRLRTSGRIATPPRVMGKAAFVHLSDGVSRLQIYVKKADVKAVNNDTGAPVEEEGKGWELFNLLDHGDFIGVEGFLFVTKTGELSIHVTELQFLSKALLPMPDKLHGIADPEIRQRQRYADLIAGSLKVEREENELTTREIFELRSKVIRELRRFLDDHGYIEVETPMLTPLATGAAAKPFKTHHNALDIDLYARIAPELYLKRLLVGGFEKVYELNRNFRNEGIGYRWNPEFTMLEFYCAYMDVNGMMDFCEEMLRSAILNATGSLQVKYSGNPQPLTAFAGRRPLEKEITIDFSKFGRLTMKQAICRNISQHIKELISEDVESWLDNGANSTVLHEFYWWSNNRSDELWNEFNAINNATGEVIPLVSQEEQRRQIEEMLTKEAPNKWKEINESYANQGTSKEKTAKDLLALFEDFVEKELEQPTFIIDYPKIVSPLSKSSPSNPNIAERFELFVAKMELANGFSELNDPEEQRDRFLEQMQQRERGDEEAMLLDEDYIRALSYGMPPAAGIGIGIDRLVMILANKHTIREVILFPHMRPERQQAVFLDKIANLIKLAIGVVQDYHAHESMDDTTAQTLAVSLLKINRAGQAYHNQLKPYLNKLGAIGLPENVRSNLSIILDDIVTTIRNLNVAKYPPLAEVINNVQALVSEGQSLINKVPDKHSEHKVEEAQEEE